jgi:succinylglutamate desuccinylase
MTKKDILFIYRTHGDEGVGEYALKVLAKQKRTVTNVTYDTIIGNPEAKKKDIRFIDCDLNRSAPGSQNSKLYEKRRAAQLLRTAQNYKAIVDLHGATAHSGIFTIVTNPTKKNLELALALPIKHIVIWKSTAPSKTGPITQFVNRGVEIECGPQNSKKIIAKLAAILGLITSRGLRAVDSSQKEIFVVYGKIIKKEYGKRKIAWRDFKKAKYQGEEFYPLLVGQYEKYICYKMKTLTKNQITSILRFRKAVPNGRSKS